MKKSPKLLVLLLLLILVVLLTAVLILTYRSPEQRRIAAESEAMHSVPQGQIMQLLGRAYSEMEDGHADAAEDILKEIVRRQRHPMALRLLGRLYYETGRFSEAEEIFRILVKRNMFDAAAHNNLGQTLFRRGQNAEALEELKKSLELNPESPMVHLNLSGVYNALSDPESAREHLMEARKMLLNQSANPEDGGKSSSR